MKKALSYSLIILIFGLAVSALATPKYGVMTFYTILGQVNGIQQAPSAGRQVVFFRDITGNTVSVYTTATVDATGKFNVSASSNLDLLPLKVGLTYHVAVVQDAQGYGAGPADFKLSGFGYDTASAMTMAKGAGVVLSNGPQGEAAPNIALWFGNRLYQPSLVTADNPFIVTEQPTLKVNASIGGGYSLASDIKKGYSIVVDSGTATAKTLDLSTAAMSSQVYAAGAAAAPSQLTSMSLVYAMTEALSSGAHNFVVSAQSSGATGAPGITTMSATVEVMAGPVRLIGTPVTFPSPFNITKDKIVTIQYTLSKDAAIEIVLTDISGQRIKNFAFASGAEGGTAGLNKVTWDGKTDLGPLSGNGIYLGIIVAKDEGRKLGSVKVSILTTP